uniref:Uncharacterized protein n=1 Tax=Paramoeba aestuarina TaxID=180227 RepID=A0A7S4L7F7_9EUKA|mmetsp:Transcript_32682/g.51080  ORF Transcript_32682/g.51080 Transcript_32682/m.51080 type:complete len:201 (+) Transcript_32682:86-688(+)
MKSAFSSAKETRVETYKRLYHEGELEGYRIGMAERIAQVQTWKIGAIAGSVVLGVISFSVCLVRFRAIMQQMSMEIKQIKKEISMKEQELSTIRSQKSVLQTSHSHHLLTYSQQKRAVQNDYQNLLAENYMLIDNLQNIRHSKRPQLEAVNQLSSRIRSCKLLSAGHERSTEERAQQLLKIRTLMTIYVGVLAFILGILF